jgi:pimeloyl-ACP methyl ester carboxylesterase
MKKSSRKLPIGYFPFHEKQVYNYQFNRWHSLGFARYEDMMEAGQRLQKFTDWKKIMVDLADRALEEQRYLNAAIYYRGAEFYITQKDPDKLRFYKKFLDLFYQHITDTRVEQFKIPYNNGFLPAYRIKPSRKSKKTVIMHGGFDSFIEEFYFQLQIIAEKGYDVIAFEGPGQGGARRLYDQIWDEQWEKPTATVLDFFKLNTTALYGISMGGHLCLRAAAFEPRIDQVISSGGALDYRRIANPLAQGLLKLFMHFEKFTRRALEKKMENDPHHHWLVKNSMFITNINDPLAAMRKMLDMTKQNIQPQRLTQDILILTSRHDHFIPMKNHKMLMNAFPNARSVSGRVFTKEEHADNHCQIGNIPLACDIISNWLS